ncbi:hypothetical protein SAMN02745157_0101 [Kaistia soli DSM 19436]|uniref:Uncharacterized protein n=1 Tax=Kaistia soli DSM 19436 TaxID=1122133 RepID=A0A1M5P9Q2_9HYPH|nr:hypothetical protein [Kaistia soli]SHG98551.1 hypothetical protein SAMN02745157_0101 [Kaistia soli DSM 19436]
MPKWSGQAARLTDVVARFHDRELEIWRRCAHDPAFHEVCQDYQEAVEASRYWASPDHPDAGKVEEYRALVADLESEILSALG